MIKSYPKFVLVGTRRIFMRQNWYQQRKCSSLAASTEPHLWFATWCVHTRSLRSHLLLLLLLLLLFVTIQSNFPLRRVRSVKCKTFEINTFTLWHSTGFAMSHDLSLSAWKESKQIANVSSQTHSTLLMTFPYFVRIDIYRTSQCNRAAMGFVEIFQWNYYNYYFIQIEMSCTWMWKILTRLPATCRVGVLPCHLDLGWPLFWFHIC